ncbi:gas vesicle protein [Streptosporangiaceae bacterium NEAU-GS5]|nr:gas vesicle protein [Streptosporangiaceae bacterium NEAU-GS5]
MSESSSVMRQPYNPSASREPANLGDILERVLDRGIVIAGDIRVNLLDIELLTIKLRLIIASVDTAREMGIDWWEHDPWLSGKSETLQEENRSLRRRLAALEEAQPSALESRDSPPDVAASVLESHDSRKRPTEAGERDE